MSELFSFFSFFKDLELNNGQTVVGGFTFRMMQGY